MRKRLIHQVEPTLIRKRTNRDPALQFTEEKMGRAERTENDPQFAVLSDKTDKTKNYTEKFVKVGNH